MESPHGVRQRWVPTDQSFKTTLERKLVASAIAYCSKYTGVLGKGGSFSSSKGNSQVSNINFVCQVHMNKSRLIK